MPTAADSPSPPMAPATWYSLAPEEVAEQLGSTLPLA